MSINNGGVDFRAVVCKRYGDFADLEMHTMRRAPLGPREVRIQVAFAGVSFAHSLVVAGKYQRKPPLPFTPGTEAAGEVIEVGAEVSRVSTGQRVFAALDWGAYAEEAVADEVNVFPLPDELPLDGAVALPISYGTAYGALMWRARIQAGDTVLVHGAAGGVGLAAAEIATAAGARVLAVVTGQAKVETLTKQGFGDVIDAGSADIREQVNRLTEAQGVDVVFDPIGGEVFHTALRCLGDGGRLLTIGYASGEIPEVAANILLLKNIGVLGFNWGHYVGWGKVDERHRYADRVRSAMEQLVAWWHDGMIAPTIHRRFALHDYCAAMDELKQRQSVGRVVLDTRA